MKIRFNCSCGRILTVSAAKAGKRGKCPQCGRTLKVPQPSESCENPDRVVPPVHPALQSASPSKQTSLSGKRRIVLCSAAGGGVLLLVICVFLISRLFTSSEQDLVTGSSELVGKVEDMSRASHIASNGGENSNRAGMHEHTVASGGNAHASSDNHSDTPDTGPERVLSAEDSAVRTAWCTTYNNFVVDHIDVSPEVINDAGMSRLLATFGELADDDRVGKVSSALGMSRLDTVSNIVRFSARDTDLFVDRVVVLVDDPETRAVVNELGASYRLFVFLAAAASRNPKELLPRVRQAVAGAKRVSSKTNLETERIAIAAAASSHEISVFFERAEAAVAEDKRNGLAEKLGQDTSTFVLSMAAKTLALNDCFEQACQAVDVAKSLAPKTGIGQPKLAVTALESVYSPKQFATRVENALSYSGIGDTAAKAGWKSGVCAVLAGNSRLEPTEFLKRLSVGLDFSQTGTVAKATKLNKGYLAVMAAESRRPIGPFFDDVRKAMNSKKCKKLSEETGTRLGQAAVIIAFTNGGG